MPLSVMQTLAQSQLYQLLLHSQGLHQAQQPWGTVPTTAASSALSMAVQQYAVSRRSSAPALVPNAATAAGTVSARARGEHLSTEVQAEASNTQAPGTHDGDEKGSTVATQLSGSPLPAPNHQAQQAWQPAGLQQPTPVPHQPGPAVSFTQEVSHRQQLPLPPHILQDISAFLNGVAAAQIPLHALTSAAVPHRLASALAAAHDSAFRLETGTHDFAALVRDSVWRVFPGSPDVCHAMVQVLLGATATNSGLCTFHVRYSGLSMGTPEVCVSPALVSLFCPSGVPPSPLVHCASSLTTRAATPSSKSWGRTGSSMHISPTTPLAVPHNFISAPYMDPASLRVRQAAGAQAASEQVELMHVCSVFNQLHAEHGTPSPLSFFSARETLSTFWSVWDGSPFVDGVFSVIERVVPLQAQLLAHTGPAHTVQSSTISTERRSAAGQGAHPSPPPSAAVGAGFTVRIPVPNALVEKNVAQHSPNPGAGAAQSTASSEQGAAGLLPEQRNRTEPEARNSGTGSSSSGKQSNLPYTSQGSASRSYTPPSAPPAPAGGVAAAPNSAAGGMFEHLTTSKAQRPPPVPPLAPAAADARSYLAAGGVSGGVSAAQDAMQVLSQTPQMLQPVAALPPPSFATLPGLAASVGSSSLGETASDALKAWGRTHMQPPPLGYLPAAAPWTRGGASGVGQWPKPQSQSQQQQALREAGGVALAATPPPPVGPPAPGPNGGAS